MYIYAGSTDLHLYTTVVQFESKSTCMYMFACVLQKHLYVHVCVRFIVVRCSLALVHSVLRPKVLLFVCTFVCAFY